MNPSRKIRPQRALSHLTEEERDQIVEWLKTNTYEKVLARLAKPRSEGGYDTHVSRGVLEVLRQRYALAEALSEHADERIAMDDFLAILNAEPISYHEATLHIVQRNAFKLSLLPVQSASMLYTLMRIANNPFNRDLAKEKLALQKRALELRESKKQKANAETPSQPQRKADELGPYARNLDELEERAFRKFGVPESEWPARRAMARKAREEREKLFAQNQTPGSTLPSHT
jgi:hypothetical protein